ncbi:hypothetical protein ACFQJ8_27500 [Halocatena marina]|uniref:hypothetical protein n=1 Tax=Halocatena marina TaxID=2934937 RepID=UPI00361F838A
MSLQRDVCIGVRIGRAEFTRSVRRAIQDERRLIGLGVVVLFFGANLFFALPTAYAIGRTARSVASIPFFGVGATAVPVMLVFLATFRTLERIGSIEAEDLLLMSVHPRAIVVGLIGAEVGRLAAWFGVPPVAFAAAFTLGLGSPSFLITTGIVTLPLICWAAVWGYACGIGVLRVLRRLPGIHRALKVGWVLAMLGLIVASQFVGHFIAEEGLSIQAFLSSLTFASLADYIALAFVGTPLAQPISAYALGILTALVTLTPVGLVIAARQASKLWFTDVESRDGTQGTKISTGGFTAPRPFVWTRSGRIAWGFLVRGVRQPQELSHLVMILFFIGPLGPTVVSASGDALGPLVAGIGVGLGTYLAGATFGLNPLGDDQPQLPLLLLTDTEPRTIIQGRQLASCAVGGPVAVLVPLISVLLGTTLLSGLAFAVVGIGMCLAAAHFAVGLGSAYPIYEEREFWGTETVVPSTLVMMVYQFVVGGGTVLGLLMTWYVVTGQLVVTAVFSVGFGVYLLLTVGVSYWSYRYAIRRYRRHTLD